jgi:hypothetical protein
MQLAGRWDCEECGTPYDGNQDPVCTCNDITDPDLKSLLSEWYENADEEWYPERGASER